MQPERRRIPIPLAILLAPVVAPLVIAGFLVAALVDAMRALSHIHHRR